MLRGPSLKWIGYKSLQPRHPPQRPMTCSVGTRQRCPARNRLHTGSGVAVTVACGEFDAPFLIARGRELAGRPPDGRYRELSRMAHQPYLEQPVVLKGGLRFPAANSGTRRPGCGYGTGTGPSACMPPWRARQRTRCWTAIGARGPRCSPRIASRASSRGLTYGCQSSAA